MMSVLEQRFLETVPLLLKKIVEELIRLNETLKEKSND